jgi:hypothetical protein
MFKFQILMLNKVLFGGIMLKNLFFCTLLLPNLSNVHIFKLPSIYLNLICMKSNILYLLLNLISILKVMKIDENGIEYAKIM